MGGPNPYLISTKQWKENRNHALPKFGKIAKPHKAADYYDYCYGFANSNPDSNGTDSDFYRPRLLGHYWCMVNGTPVELPVYHVRDARDYIRWWLDDKQGRVPGTREVVKVDTYQQLFRPGTHAYEQAVKFDNNWVYLPIPCSKGGYIGETSKHFMHLETEQIPNPRYAEIQSSLDALTKSVEDIEAGITVTFSDGVTPVTMEYLTNEINNAHYRLSITSRYITVNHGYGQLYPLVKRIDYERTIQEMARETSM